MAIRLSAAPASQRRGRLGSSRPPKDIAVADPAATIWSTTQPIQEPAKPEHLGETIRWIAADRLRFSKDNPYLDNFDQLRRSR